MGTTYRSLLECDCTHQYFELGKDAFEITPSTRTMDVLRRSGLLFRPTDNGFCVLYPEVPPGVPLRELPAELHLSFSVFAKNEFLNNITNLEPTRFSGTAVYANNLHIKSAAGKLCLNSKAATNRYISNDDLRTITASTINIREESVQPITAAVRNTFDDSVAFRFIQPEQGICQTQFDLSDQPEGEYRTVIEGKVGTPYLLHPRAPGRTRFAIIDLYAGPSVAPEHSYLTADGAPQFREYALNFKRRKTKWKYLVVPRFTDGIDDSNLSVIDTQARYTFKDPAPQQTLTGETAYCFESNESIPVQRENIKGINLKRNGNLVMVADLRSPNFQDIRKDGNKFCSEMFIYV